MSGVQLARAASARKGERPVRTSSGSPGPLASVMRFPSGRMTAASH